MHASQALAGIRVLDLSRLLPGPFLTLILADLGADVVKVEDPRLGDYMRNIPPGPGGGMSGSFLAVNRGKRSLALDLKAPAGRAAFLRLAATADVVVESFRPGVMDKLGVGWEALHAANPRLVLCSISGYGQTGPYRDRAGHDLNYIGLGGVLAMTGPRGGAPQVPGVQIGDFAGGGLWGATGVLAALVARGVSGQGQHVDISMTEGALALLAGEVGDMGQGGQPTRGAGILNGGNACYGVYLCADGKAVSVAPLEPKFWAAFNQAIGRPVDYAEIIGPPDVQERVRTEIQAVLVTRTRDAWMAIFEGKDVCVEPVLELAELPDHPQHQARGMFVEVHGARQLRLPIGSPASERPAPALGEHTDEVLGGFGFSADEIAALRNTRVVS